MSVRPTICPSLRLLAKTLKTVQNFQNQCGSILIYWDPSIAFFSSDDDASVAGLLTSDQLDKIQDRPDTSDPGLKVESFFFSFFVFSFIFFYWLLLQYVFLQPPPKNISYLRFLMSYRSQLGPKLKVIDCVFCL